MGERNPTNNALNFQYFAERWIILIFVLTFACAFSLTDGSEHHIKGI
jgi:hypothetical protein